MRYSILLTYKKFNYKFFERCFNSVLCQLIQPDQLIIIDDSGVKNNGKKYLLRKFNKKKIIFLKNKKNMGIPYSLNRGINYCKNNFLFRIDIDDEWEKNHVFYYSEIVKKNPNYLFYANNIRYHGLLNFIKLDNFLVIDNPFLHSSLLINLKVKKIKYHNYFPEDYGTLSFYKRLNYNIYSIKKKTVKIYNTSGSQGKLPSANIDFLNISSLNLNYLRNIIKSKTLFLKIIYKFVYYKIIIIKFLKVIIK